MAVFCTLQTAIVLAAVACAAVEASNKVKTLLVAATAAVLILTNLRMVPELILTTWPALAELTWKKLLEPLAISHTQRSGQPPSRSGACTRCQSSSRHRTPG